MKYAIVRNGVVEQIILWDGANGWTPPKGTQAVPCDDTTKLADLYDGKNFTTPDVAVPVLPAPPQDVVGPDNLTDSERATFKMLAAKVAG